MRYLENDNKNNSLMTKSSNEKLRFIYKHQTKKLLKISQHINHVLVTSGWIFIAILFVICMLPSMGSQFLKNIIKKIFNRSIYVNN